METHFDILIVFHAMTVSSDGLYHGIQPSNYMK